MALDGNIGLAMAPEPLSTESLGMLEFEELEENSGTESSVSNSGNENVLEQSLAISPTSSFVNEKDQETGLSFGLPFACKSLSRSSITLLESYSIGTHIEIQTWIVGKMEKVEGHHDSLRVGDCYEVSRLWC